MIAEVLEDDLHLALVAGVDDTRRVEDEDAMLGGESAARAHERDLVRLELQRDARADDAPESVRDDCVLGCVQVPRRVVVVALGDLAVDDCHYSDHPVFSSSSSSVISTAESESHSASS